MDLELAARLTALKNQAVSVREAESEFRQAEATKKSLFAQAFLKTNSTLSVVARESCVYASQEWLAFAKALALAETNYNFARMRFDILKDAYYAELNTFKREHSLG